MKIKNERIFTADIFEGRWNKKDEWVETPIKKEVVLVKFGESWYVPAVHIRSLFKHAEVASHIKDKGHSLVMGDDRFLTESPDYMKNVSSSYYIKNLKRLFAFDGKTSVTELLGIQKLNNENDDTIGIIPRKLTDKEKIAYAQREREYIEIGRGGMEIM